MPSDAEDMVIFEEWMKHRNKSYETEAEKLKRFEIFKVRLREAEEEFPLAKEPLWLALTIFADLTDEDFDPHWPGYQTESDDEDDRNGVYEWYLDESSSEESMSFENWGKERKVRAVRAKRKGVCSCDDEKDHELDDAAAAVKRQRPCSCVTSPPPAAAAAAGQEDDATAPVV